jgi:hypothetical protein
MLYTVYHMPAAKSTARQVPVVRVPDPPHKPRKRNPAQFTDLAKERLDHVKQVEHLDTYNDAIEFLYHAWRKNLPECGGMMPDLPEFVRDEEDDPYRIPY